MSAQSFEWIAWVVAGVVGHWIVPARCRDPFLIVLTCAFLCVYSPLSAIVLVVLTLSTYGMTRGRPVSSGSVTLLGIGIITVLGVFRYLQGERQFGSETGGLLIPLGLSYYTLRCLHYAIERYKGTLTEHTLFDFVAYQFFLPTIAWGPIHRFPEFYRDQHRRRWDSLKFSRGLERILFGYAKITVLGNFLVSQILAERITYRVAIDGLGNIGSPGDPWLPLFVYLDLLRHGFNLYFQFSGYSDVAIGMSLLFGFNVMENFDWPFLKSNLSDFWQSWHISLTSWCREYIYMVVISTWRSPALAAVTTMLAIGFWHEMSFRYLIWGVYHGMGIAIWQRFQRVKPRLPAVTNAGMLRGLHVLSILLTFHFVILGFSIVQGPNLSAAVQRWKILFLFWMS
jgi:alginate O-acetyltransferase complex protein AlgI